MSATSPTHIQVNINPNSAALKSTLVILDPGVTDFEMLAAGVVSEAFTLVLDPNRDGILQITEALQAYPQVTSLHIISHGEPACLFLGNRQLNLETFEHYAWDLQSWFSLAPHTPYLTPQILLYGCNVASGDKGEEFLAKLHQFTGANIAASISLTGSAALGGNWRLEARIGKIEPELALSPETQANYRGVFSFVSKAKPMSEN